MPGRPSTPGRLLRLEVEDFKSYRGHQEIGPFKQFTAVIGPNGAGKSNLMDAISFVLGVRTAHLRGNLKELLYSGGDSQAENRPRRGFVKLVYQTGFADSRLPPVCSDPRHRCRCVAHKRDALPAGNLWQASARLCQGRLSEEHMS